MQPKVVRLRKKIAALKWTVSKAAHSCCSLNMSVLNSFSLLEYE